MSDTAIVREMSKREAEKCCEMIRDRLRKMQALGRAMANHDAGIRELVYDLAARSGWKALGYRSQEECFRQEFEQSRATVFRQLAAARIEAEVVSPETFGRIAEAKCRALAELPEGQRKIAWDEATDGGKKNPVADEVRKVVERHKEKLEDETATVQVEAIRRAERAAERDDVIVDADDNAKRLNEAARYGIEALTAARRGWQAARRAKNKIKNSYAIYGRRAIVAFEKGMNCLAEMLRDCGEEPPEEKRKKGP